MNKKIFLLIICIIFTTACNNQNHQEQNIQKKLCSQIKDDINNYQNNNLTKEELYSKLENYNNTCSNSLTNICINIKAIISIPKEKEEIRKEYLTNLLNNCKNE